MINHIKAQNKAAGHHFFDRDSLEFFNSRIGTAVYGTEKTGYYFITSEQNSENRYPRLYTIRRADPKLWTIDTVGEFQQYHSQTAARAAVIRLVKEQKYALLIFGDDVDFHLENIGNK